MLVATKTFLANDPLLGEIRFVEGSSYCAEDYWYALEQPHLFRHAETFGGGSRQERVYASGEPLRVSTVDAVGTRVQKRRQRSDVRFVSESRQIRRGLLIGGSPGVALHHGARPAGSFRLAPGLLDRIAEEIADGGDAETGGAMFGYADRSLVDVVRVTGPGDGANRSRDALTFDVDHLNREAADAKAHGLSLIALWHTHPRAAVNHLPSAADLRYFDALRGDDPVFGALIAVPTMEGDDWTMTGWRITRGACLPMRVLECQ